MRIFTVFCLFCLMSQAAIASSESPTNAFILASLRQAPATIVMPAKSSETLHFAASELQKYAKRMTGQEMNIADGGAKAKGRCVALKVTPRRLVKIQSDDFRIRVANKNLEITGASERAVLYGVYHLLERAGCRWIGPGEEVVPAVESIAFPSDLDIRESPALQWRGMQLISGSNESIIDWMAKMKLNVAWPENYVPNGDMSTSLTQIQAQAVPAMKKRGMSVFWGGHILPILFPIDKYKDHPEYFAVINGKRLNPDVKLQERNQLCVSNPEALRILAGNAVQFLRNHPWLDVVFLWGGDTVQWCECEKCRALLPDPGAQTTFGGRDCSALYLTMIKAVTSEVKKQLPGKKIGFNHYYNLENIPKDKNGEVIRKLLPGNQTLSGVDDYHQCDRHPFSDKTCTGGKQIAPIARTWSTFYNDSVMWTYYFAWNFTMGLPISMAHKIPDDCRYVKTLGINGVIDNVTLDPGSVHWRNNLLNFYIYAKALWNPELDLDATQAEFFEASYGPAAKPMAQAWNSLEECTRHYGLDPAFMPDKAELAQPVKIHNRMRDMENLPELTHGAASPEFIHYLVPNRSAYDRVMSALDEARKAAEGASDPAYIFRINLIRNTIGAWDKDQTKYKVFGFMNGGGQNKNLVYDFRDDQITCSVLSGRNIGDCFWSKGVKSNDALSNVGDAVELAVKINMPITGDSLYRSGPGLYIADSQTSACGTADACSLMLFISNENNDKDAPRRVIAMANNGQYGTAIKSSEDNAWAYGEDVRLRVEYSGDSGSTGKSARQYSYRCQYDAGKGWKEIAVLQFKRQMTFAAPYFHFATEKNHPDLPVMNWAEIRDFSILKK